MCGIRTNIFCLWMRLRWMYVSQECDCLLCEMSVSHFDFTVRFGLDNLIEGFRCVIV